MVRAAMFVALLAGAAGLSAQSPSVSPTPPVVAFEVASIKPASADSARQGMPSPDRFHASGFTLRALIGYAYAMDEFRVLGGPAWVGSERWEVSARASRAPSRAEMRMMVQRLIAERYGLRTHVETRDLPTYSLVLARGDGQLGPNMQPAAVDCDRSSRAVRVGAVGRSRSAPPRPAAGA